MKLRLLLMVALALLLTSQLAQAQLGLNQGGNPFSPGPLPPSGLGALTPNPAPGRTPTPAPPQGTPPTPEPAPGRTPTPAPPQGTPPTAAYLPIGATAQGGAADSGYAWFIDQTNQRVLLCMKVPATPTSCESVAIPAVTP